MEMRQCTPLLHLFHILSDVKHLICLFHLFDMNVKKRVQPVLISRFLARALGKDSRKGLAVCREAQSERELERLWNSLLQNGFHVLRVQHLLYVTESSVWSNVGNGALRIAMDLLHVGHLHHKEPKVGTFLRIRAPW